MKCKRCGSENPDTNISCTECGAFLEGYTLNKVTGQEVIKKEMEEKMSPLVCQMTKLMVDVFQAGFDAGLSCGKFVNYKQED